jgi:hypothetical protein
VRRALVSWSRAASWGARHFVYRALAAPRLLLHVPARLPGGVSVLLGDRGRVRRLCRPSGQPRRHALGGVAGAACEIAGVQAADGLDVFLGVLAQQRLQHLLHPDTTSRPAAHAGPRLPRPTCRIKLPVDSLLEGTGFEPLVPHRKTCLRPGEQKKASSSSSTPRMRPGPQGDREAKPCSLLRERGT